MEVHVINLATNGLVKINIFLKSFFPQILPELKLNIHNLNYKIHTYPLMC
jgi:hypothetical protein